MRKPHSDRESGERGATAVDKHLGEFVRTARIKAAMGQVRLAEILGVTFQQVQKYEKGVNRISASRLFDISLALDIPIQDFFEGLPRPEKKTRGGVSADEAPKPVKRPRKKRT